MTILATCAVPLIIILKLIPLKYREFVALHQREKLKT